MWRTYLCQRYLPSAPSRILASDPKRVPMSPYRLFLLMSGINALALDMAFTLNLVYQTKVVGLGPLQLVLVGTVLEIVLFVAQIPTGVIADLYSRRLSIVIGYSLMGAGLL